jgi:hypothetical protein
MVSESSYSANIEIGDRSRVAGIRRKQGGFVAVVAVQAGAPTHPEVAAPIDQQIDRHRDVEPAILSQRTELQVRGSRRTRRRHQDTGQKGDETTELCVP